MPQHVCNGATLMCSFGTAPSTMVVLPQNCTLTSNMPAANIMDNKPMVNIMPFGMCAAPVSPCVPVTPAPWILGSPTVILGNMPALDNTNKLMCMRGGVISVVNPGQVTEQIP